MYRSYSPFRKFSLRSLLAAGAVASLGLPLSREAYGIGGSFIQPSGGSPRETVGAAPSATLIGASTSSSAAAASTSSGGGGGEAPTQAGGGGGGTRHVTSDDEGNGTTAKHRARKQGKTTGKTAVADNSKGGKDYKQPPLVAARADLPQFSLSAGYETRYIYHGLDIISFNLYNFNPRTGAYQPTSSGIYYAGGDVSWKGFHIGVSYINSINEEVPFVQGSYRDVFIANKIDFSREYYQEIDFKLDYTVAVVAKVLDATIGYDSYILPNKDFRGTHDVGELLFRLAYKQIPYITPSFTFYHDFTELHSDLVGNENGSLVEFRIDGAVPIIKRPDFLMVFAPYVSSTYNIDYLNYTGTNANIGGFSFLQTGISLPTTIKKHFTVTPYGNYGMDLTSSKNDQPINSFTNNIYGERTHFWGGVTFTYSF